MKKSHKNEVAPEENGMTLRDFFAATVELPLEHSLAYAEKIVGRAQPNYLDKPEANAAFWAEFRSRLRFIEANAMLQVRGEE